MGLNGKPYQRSGGGPFSRGGGGGGGGGGRGGGRNGGGRGRGGDGGGGGGGGGKAGRDNNRERNNNGGGGRGGGRGGRDDRRGGGGGGGPRQQGADVLGAMLNLMFEKHFNVMYDSNTGILNLASFREAPDLVAVQSAIDFNAVAFCKSLVYAIKNSPVGIPRFINLANNRISNLTSFLRAIDDEGMSGGIVGLALSNNNLKDVNFVGVLTRFNSLTELALDNNPFADPHYRRVLERRLTNLNTLNGESIRRPPLGLPFPNHSNLSPDAKNILMFLETALFQALSAGNTQLLMTTYHQEAVFACSAEQRFNIPVPQGCEKNIREDTVSLRNSLRDNDSNLLNRGGVSRVVKGRTQLLATLENSLYHKKFRTHHQLIGDGNVSFITSTPVPVAVATVHGKMMWLHQNQNQSEAPRSALFDRTITLVSVNGGWQVTNDIMYLRRQFTEEPLFFADNPSRIDHLCKSFGSVYPPEIFAAFVAASSSDKDYYNLRDGIPKEIIEQCYQMGGNDATRCVAIAKLALARQCAPQDAFNALNAVGFDASRL